MQGIGMVCFAQHALPLHTLLHNSTCPNTNTHFQELSTFHAKLVQQRAARESVVQEQRAKAGTLGAANKFLLDRQFGRKEDALPEGNMEQQQPQQQGLQPSTDAAAAAAAGQHLSSLQGHLHTPTQQQGSSLQGESSQRLRGPDTQGHQVETPSTTTPASQGHLGSSPEGRDVQAACCTAAEAVQRLCEAALVTDAQAMLDRMLPRQETHANLAAMHSSLQAQVWRGVLAAA
jgi:hypothetical protein